MRWGPLVAWGAVAFAIAGLFAFLSGVDLNAVRPPGHAEEYVRTKFTRVIVRRRTARENIPFPPPDYQTSISIAAGKERSEERRVGKECQSVCRSRWSPYH